MLPAVGVRFGGTVYTGDEAVFKALTYIRSMFLGEQKTERLVHVVDELECCAYGQYGLFIRVKGSLVIGRQFIPPPDTVVEGHPNGGAGYKGHGKKMGVFTELFVIEPGEVPASYLISKQELYIHK